MSDYFKGWAIPGPRRALEADSPEAGRTDPDETVDALSGHFRIYQLKAGHRFSTDDLLTAWYGTSWVPCARTALDLGSGIGSVGMTAAWRLQGARFVTVEAQEASVALAWKSARLNGLLDRYEIRQGDFRDIGVLRPDETFDLVLGSPPYFPPGTGITSEHPQKLACRFEMRGDIGDYCEVASKHLAFGGLFACVFPIQPREQENRVKAAAERSGLTIVRMRPVVLREGEPPLLGLFAMMRSGDLPEAFRGRTWTEPALTIRTVDGKVHPEYSAVKLSFGFPP